MTTIKTALSMILAEEEPVEIVKRSIESIESVVDGIYITITYKDKQPESSPLIDFLKSKKVNISFWKWTFRFDEARNFAVSQIPKEYFFYLWQDADDIWHNIQNLPLIIKDAYFNNHAAVFFDYWYMVDIDEQGNVREVIVEHKRERLIRNDDSFKWIGRLHETLIPQKQFGVNQIFRKEAIVIHLTTDKRSSANLNRNIAILEETIKQEQRKDPRTLMYLAKAYFDRGKLDNEENKKKDFRLAEDLFSEYLLGSGKVGIDYRGGSGWSEERSSAWEYLSEIYRFTNQFNKAIKSTVNALIESPHFPMYYLDMAMNYVLLKDWNKADVWLNIAKYIPQPSTTLVVTPRDTKARALEIDYHIAVAKNDLDRAHNSAKKMTEIFPNNKDMLDRLQKIEELKILNKVAQSVVFVGKYLETTNQKDKIIPLIQSIPHNLEHEQFVSQMEQRFLPPKLWKKDEIAIICGPGFEKWSPQSEKRGIGGSEAAVIYVARELAKLGYKVTVYGDPQDESGEYDKVIYKPWYEVNIKDVFNILILWRAIGFVDNNFYARQTYLWAHDVPNCADYTEERLKKIDKIFVLSIYHKSLFKMIKEGQVLDITEDKFLLTKNGIITYPIKEVNRDPYRMIYASSHDRGIVHLLVSWPNVLKQVPQANLHIFYGWNTFDAIFRDNPERQLWKAQMSKLMSQPGIKDHGRVSHEALAEEFMKSGLFVYPCDFQEISCQNAMQAQLYGAVPAVTNYAALKETVQWGKKLDVDITSQEGKENYTKELVAILKDHKWQEEERKKMMEWAKDKFFWKDIASQWDKIFKEGKSKTV